MRVIIVEDSPLLGQFIEKGLKQEGHSPVLVRSLDDARAALEESEFDAMVLDRMLPDGDGLQLVVITAL